MLTVLSFMGAFILLYLHMVVMCNKIIITSFVLTAICFS